jgi:hypothetical protein
MCTGRQMGHWITFQFLSSGRMTGQPSPTRFPARFGCFPRRNSVKGKSSRQTDRNAGACRIFERFMGALLISISSAMNGFLMGDRPK